MKIRNKGKHRRWAGRPVQKLEDEYSGSAVYSDKIEYDYKGRITHKGLADPEPIPEKPLRIPEPQVPDLINKEGQIVLVPQAQAWEEYWDTINDYFDTSDFEF